MGDEETFPVVPGALNADTVAKKMTQKTTIDFNMFIYFLPLKCDNDDSIFVRTQTNLQIKRYRK
jgi:hypothetical protein